MQRFLARAWSLSEETGVPLAVSLTAAAVLRTWQAAEQALAHVRRRACVDGAPCAPAGEWPCHRVPVRPLSDRPVSGSPAAAGSLALGVLLGLAGWVWSRAILRRALQAEVLS